MLRKRYSLMLVLAMIAFLVTTGCEKSVVEPQEGFGAAKISVRIPKAVLTTVLARVEALVTAADMDTIRQDLDMQGDSLAVGIVRDIPTGQNRVFILNAFDAGEILTYSGSATANVFPGDTVSVNIQLARQTGSAEIIGVFVPPPKVEDGLVLYLPFDADFKDYSGNGNDGTSLGNVSFGEGVIGQAAYFTGNSDEAVSIPGSASLAYSGSGFTLCAWVKCDATLEAEYTILGQISQDFGGRDPYSLRLDFRRGKREISLIVMDESNNHTKIYAEIPEIWTFVCGVYRDKELEIYINGILKAQTSTPIIPEVSSTYMVLVGNTAIKPPFAPYPSLTGAMDDARIYSRPLSEKEIVALYEGGTG